jgi:MFS family permease
VSVISNRSVITGPTFISLGLMGAFFACWGTTLPALRELLRLNIEEVAMLTACGQASHAVTCLAGGILSDLFRRDRLLLFGCFFLGSGVTLIGSLTSFPANVLLVIWMGFGSGLILSSSNALLVGLYPTRKGPIMNFHHGVFGVGSFLSPLIMGQLLAHDHRWPYGYDGLGIILFAVAAFFLFTRVPTSRTQGLQRFYGDLRRLFLSFRFIHLVLMGFLAVGTQFALMFLSVTFLVEVKGLSIFNASVVLSLFFVCLLIGRAVCGWLSGRVLNTKIILILLYAQVTSIAVVWRGSAWISAVALVVAGLACSAIFPSLLALTGTLFSEVAGTSLGVLATMNSLGGMVIIGISGLLSHRLGLGLGFGAMAGSSLAALLLFVSIYRKLVNEEKVLWQRE